MVSTIENMILTSLSVWIENVSLTALKAFVSSCHKNFTVHYLMGNDSFLTLCYIVKVLFTTFYTLLTLIFYAVRYELQG